MKPLERVRFGEFLLDASSRQLLRGGAPLHLSTKAFDLLCLLIAHRPRAVPKGELFNHLWPDTVVLEANISNLVAEIRAAIGDDPKRPHLIRTVHRYGYAFLGQVDTEPREAPDPGRDTLSWVLWDEVRVQLKEGDHLVGRHPGSIVPIAAATVSRHHAVIRVRGEEATLEDLGSRNGTAVNGQGIDQPRALQDGDRITLGPVTLTYRLASLASATVDTEAGATTGALPPAQSRSSDPGPGGATSYAKKGPLRRG